MRLRRDEPEQVGPERYLVYIAGTVEEAATAERLLCAQGIGYTFSLDTFTTTSPLGGEYAGLFFYVARAEHARCRRLLEAGGLRDTIALALGEAEEHRGTGR
ncbi:hypothetical protein [Nitrospira sp. Kam-Ns4a]